MHFFAHRPPYGTKTQQRTFLFRLNGAAVNQLNDGIKNAQQNGILNKSKVKRECSLQLESEATGSQKLSTLKI